MSLLNRLFESKDAKQKRLEARRLAKEAKRFADLVTSLADTDFGVRITAVLALGQIGGAQAVEQLMLTIMDNSASVREATLQALEKIGGAVVVEQIALSCLNDRDRGVQKTALGVLERLGTPESKRAIEEFKEAEKQEIRFKSLVRELTSNNEESLRQDAAREIAKFGGIKATKALVSSLKSPFVRLHPKVQKAVIGGLEHIGEPALEFLLNAILHGDFDQRLASRITLMNMNIASIKSEKLNDAVASVRWTIRNWTNGLRAHVKEGLRLIRNPGAIPTEDVVEDSGTQDAEGESRPDKELIQLLADRIRDPLNNWLDIEAAARMLSEMKVSGDVWLDILDYSNVQWTAEELAMEKIIDIGYAQDIERDHSKLQWAAEKIAMEELVKLGDSRVIERLFSHIHYGNTKMAEGLLIDLLLKAAQSISELDLYGLKEQKPITKKVLVTSSSNPLDLSSHFFKSNYLIRYETIADFERVRKLAGEELRRRGKHA